jgi:hypothetical protein
MAVDIVGREQSYHVRAVSFWAAALVRRGHENKE